MEKKFEKKKNNAKLPPNQLPLQVSKFRRLLPEVLANCIKNLLSINMGLIYIFPTITIPRLLDLVENKNEKFVFDKDQASWFGSIKYIFITSGTLLSGFVAEAIGMKRSFLIGLIPGIIGWLFVYLSYNVAVIFIAYGIASFGLGLYEPSVISYTGETGENSIRGILLSLNSITVTFGIFSGLLLGPIIKNWRHIALFCFCFSMFTWFAIFLIPESPVWLLSKNRKKEAIQNLQCLRGGVADETVRNEFELMKRNIEKSKRCDICLKENLDCNHPSPSLKKKILSFKEKEHYRAFFIVIFLQVICHNAGYLPMRPFLIQVLRAYKVPLDAEFSGSLMGFAQIFGNILCTLTLKFLRKRRLYIIAVCGNILCCLYLSIFGSICFPSNYTSFEYTIDLNYPQCDNYFTLFVCCMLSFFTSYGFSSMPWMLLGEILPFKYKKISVGFLCSIFYLIQFSTSKSYIYVEEFLNLNGVMWYFLMANIFGLFFAYFFLVETEGKSLNQIEDHLKNTKFTDTKPHILVITVSY